LFEPDRENFVRLSKVAAATPVPSLCLPLALSNGYQMLSFNAGNGEAGAITKDGSSHVAAVALDDVLHGHAVDFIKLDVEGAEIQALMGATKTIEHFRPILAISLYHRAQDIWEVPKLLKSLCPDYLFNLRQHWFNSFDSVLYAVPEYVIKNN
jgi:FkbM family methyltransferase